MQLFEEKQIEELLSFYLAEETVVRYVWVLSHFILLAIFLTWSSASMSMEDTFERKATFDVFVSSPPAEVFDAFVEYLWWGGGGLPAPGVVAKGAADGLTGSIRSVSGGIHEEILSAEKGISIVYTLRKKSFFPVSHHLGRVSFGKQAGGTLVTWEVGYTPFRCMNLLVVLLLNAIPFMLSNLRKHVESGSCKKIN